MGPIFFSPGDSHTKGSLVLLHLALEGITEADTDPKEGFVSFKVTPLPLMTEFSVFMPLQGIYQAVRVRFLKGLQNYMENKNEGNENKIIVEDFNCNNCAIGQTL